LQLLAERQLHAVAVPSLAPEMPDEPEREPDEPDAGVPRPMSTSLVSAEPFVNSPPRSRLGRGRGAAAASPLEQAILMAIEAGARDADQVGARACLSAAEVSHGLLLLTLKGDVRQGLSGELTIAR
jgi:hypothetical protein